MICTEVYLNEECSGLSRIVPQFYPRKAKNH